VLPRSIAGPKLQGMTFPFHVTVYGRPDLSGDLRLDQSYGEGDRLRLEGVLVEVVLRDDAGIDQRPHPVLNCKVIDEPGA